MNILSVTNVLDSGPGSLRECMILAMQSNNSCKIIFKIYDVEPTIFIFSPLPIIAKPIIIDGTTQQGYTTHPIVMIDGSNLPSYVNGIVVTGGLSTICGLSVVNFPGYGIHLSERGNNIVQSNFLGIARDGITSQGNHLGLLVTSSHNLVGGTNRNRGEGNVMSGNHDNGMSIDSGNNNLVYGNYFGLSSDGLQSVGNGINGLAIRNGCNNHIGGAKSGQRNIISGNFTYGI